ncbi:MAG: bL35 family ribosomal protein [Candidatus Gracilibacteria bacterium]
MKSKTHSGIKKRVKIRKSGKLSFEKPCKQHLLSNKSKRQKKTSHFGVAVPKSHEKQIRRMLAGQAN